MDINGFIEPIQQAGQHFQQVPEQVQQFFGGNPTPAVPAEPTPVLPSVPAVPTVQAPAVNVPQSGILGSL
ncbi:hypothetical protein [Corynebacterium terpenotabidum]|uniref:Uncharacterized protein n=1 Tax=Corynebacterium terpenotabidum Y-11 TaxID=1200352 RepID=S4XG79_9CORY|nr:hypothetical protein [Corynebacterium terpenotabidum]AGP31584.1 hypothetical protein A606_09725 [Corynebacterium terpenotabidum Y-11]